MLSAYNQKGQLSVVNKGTTQLPNAKPRHSHMRNQNADKSTFGELGNTNSIKMHQKRELSISITENDGSGQQFIKPSELNLEIIGPSGVRKGSKSTKQGASQATK